MNAVLALENGTVYRGTAAGAQGVARGEVVFNTSMTGYQEVLTDPSYAGQIVTMTCPQIGNYGVAPDDVESGAPKVAGFIMREESPIASNWRASGTLRDYLVANNVVAIADIDTRELTRLLRSSGVMRGIIATGDVDAASSSSRRARFRRWKASDLRARRDVRARRSTGRRGHAKAARRGAAAIWRSRRRCTRSKPLRVAAYDFGIKWNILRRLHDLRLPGARVSGVDARQGGAGGGVDGVFLSNGPGRSGRARLRHREHARAGAGGRSRSSASASAIRFSGWRSAARRSS